MLQNLDTVNNAIGKTRVSAGFWFQCFGDKYLKRGLIIPYGHSHFCVSLLLHHRTLSAPMPRSPKFSTSAHKLYCYLVVFYTIIYTYTSLCNSQEALLPFGSDSYFLDGSPSHCEPQLRRPAISHSATCTGHLSLPPACHHLPGRWTSAGAGAHPSSAPLSQGPSSRGATL